jgi:hypothetical protein
LGKGCRATYTEGVQDLDQALAALKADPTRPVRLQVGNVTVELRNVTEPSGDMPALWGLFADEPELVDEVCGQSMRARERDPLRRTDA